MICYIPTKGRFNTKTYKLFNDVGIEVIHFVEPQEFEEYDVPNKVNIKENDKGVTYVRNFMLNYAKENNEEWVIFSDDDVSSFGIYNGKTVKKDASIWFDILERAKKLPFELIGINYTQHAWHEKTSYSVNRKFAEVCVLMNVKKIDWKYEENTKEDRDFQLQTIKNGNGVLRFNHFWFSCPNVGSNEGGLFELYQNKRDIEWAKNITKKWHPYAKLVNKKGRIDARIDIKGFAKSLNKIVK
ncbi:MAG: putative beta-glucosyl-HMC-alpha-glucosyl-transferase [Prokaryotic dsDNA virus sp.]|nr:MAG: putative beta-glucosyl-HMC-alpha-glucosyl-transferase [Prokaryotic dsDNA virus sp.]|tara:strand:- start:1964 stop:2689 length:726 start_codon:yes stop_codon:yes gene_type:complete